MVLCTPSKNSTFEANGEPVLSTRLGGGAVCADEDGSGVEVSRRRRTAGERDGILGMLLREFPKRHNIFTREPSPVLLVDPYIFFILKKIIFFYKYT